MPFAPHGPLPQAEFESVYARVPRLTVEVVIASERASCSPGAKPVPARAFGTSRAAPSASVKC